MGLAGRALAAFVVAIVMVLGLSALAQAQTQPPAAAQRPSPQAFTEQFARALRAEAPQLGIAVEGSLLLKIQRPNGGSAIINIEKAYQAHPLSPGGIEPLAKAYAQALKEMPAARLDRSRIVPVIKDRAWLDELRKLFQAQGVNSEPVFEDFNKELIIVYAEDSKTRTRYLNTAEDIGDRNALRALAIENLRRIVPKFEQRVNDAGFSLVSAGGDYEPSLLLLDDVWSSGQIKVEGDIVVAIPARDVLLITGSRNRKGLKAVRSLNGDLTKGAHRLTETLFVYRNGRFVKFGRD